MQVIDFQWINKEGVPHTFRHWPMRKPRAVVCIVHGLGEHIGRYGHVAEFFSAHGIATLGFDHQGHGRSEGKRGHAHSLESLLDGIGHLLAVASEHYPGTPVFLYGHSMGGHLALNFVLRRKPNISGLIATGPWIRLPKPPSALLVGFAKVMSRIFPKLTQDNGLDVNGLSNDPAVISAYRNDPLVHSRISVRAGFELLRGAAFLDGFSGEVPCPALLMHGSLDTLTSPAGGEAFARRAKGDVTWKRWEGLKHEIHNEAQQGKVLAFLVEWMWRFC